LAGPESVFIFSGSIPRGMSIDIYARLTNIVREEGGKVFLDADGEAFAAALEEGPDFIKPNLYEMKLYFGIHEDLSFEQTIETAKRFFAKKVKTVALTLGADGAMVLDNQYLDKTKQRTLFAKALKVDVKSSVGAGDSFVGAFALSKNLKLEDAFKLAVASSAGAVATEGTKPPEFETVEKLQKQVHIEEI
jgi:1-phosphofructokinase